MSILGVVAQLRAAGYGLGCLIWPFLPSHRCDGSGKPVALMLIYRMFTKVSSWMVLCARSDTIKEIEILVLRHQLATATTHPTSTAAVDRPSWHRPGQ